jgi:hypothetical protein
MNLLWIGILYTGFSGDPARWPYRSTAECGWRWHGHQDDGRQCGMQPLSVTRSLCSAVLHLKYLKLTDRLECPRSLQHAPMLGGKVPIFLGRDKTLEPHFSAGSPGYVRKVDFSNTAKWMNMVCFTRGKPMDLEVSTPKYNRLKVWLASPYVACIQDTFRLLNVAMFFLGAPTLLDQHAYFGHVMNARGLNEYHNFVIVRLYVSSCQLLMKLLFLFMLLYCYG